ncbi:MAG: replication initiator [Acidimicrobiales bacterium]
MNDAGPGAGPDPRTLAEVLSRAADPTGFEAWRARGASAGWCRHPVRLVGASRRYSAGNGELLATFASADLPDAVLLKACGQRRATRCPTCSATYRSDAFQLVAAGLRGGKGVPEAVADHPAIFATLTAPSFGAVHSTRPSGGTPRPCRPQAGRSCAHGRSRACHAVHEPDDPALGQAICADCFDYQGAVVWNALAGELWRRSTIATRRALASLAGIAAARLAEHARLSFTKVVEYQRRGVVHVHAVIRLDNPDDPGRPPPAPFDAGLLTAALQRAATTAAVAYPPGSGVAGHARWGSQLDLHVIGGEGRVPGMVAAYLAKYATKSTDAAGALDHRLREGDLEGLDSVLNPHLARMVRTAWDLGGRAELEHLRLRPWAHTLGFKGHWLTKSRAYSTTLGALRAARSDWHATRHPGASASTPTVALGDWKFLGRGWTTKGDAWLAATAAQRAAEERRSAREERRTTPSPAASNDPEPTDAQR